MMLFKSSDWLKSTSNSQYFLLSFLALVVLGVGTVLGYAFRERIALGLQDQMYQSLDLYGRRRLTTVAWDMTQEELLCCGVEGYRDWNDRIPDSCCMDDYGDRKRPCQQLQTSLTIYRTGCYVAIMKSLRSNNFLLAGAVLVLLLFVVLATMMSYYMLTAI